MFNVDNIISYRVVNTYDITKKMSPLITLAVFHQMLTKFVSLLFAYRSIIMIIYSFN